MLEVLSGRQIYPTLDNVALRDNPWDQASRLNSPLTSRVLLFARGKRVQLLHSTPEKPEMTRI